MIELAFRALGPGSAVGDDLVVPYYLDDLKRRISIARVNDRLYAFDDLCTCARPACPLSGGYSRERRSCDSATARGSTSPPEPS